MYFDLAPAELLRKAFAGAQAIEERGQSNMVFSESHHAPGAVVIRSDQAFAGFTLLTSVAGTQAKLIDMNGKQVHSWHLPFSKAWPNPTHVTNPLSDEQIHWFHCHLYPNGDLLAIYQCDADTPHGYGLVKLDKDSNIIWRYAGNIHHDIDVASDGTIYALSQRLCSERPPQLDFIPSPYLTDDLVILSSDGGEMARIPILEAFRDSPYALMLSALEEELIPKNGSEHWTASPSPKARMSQSKRLTAPHGHAGRPIPSSTGLSMRENGDLLHANSVKVLNNELAGKFPFLQPNQALISFRNLDAIAVLDPKKRSITWAIQGMWRAQHDAQFLANGHLLFFDNSGSMRGCRVLEFDPKDNSFPWSYSHENSEGFHANARGGSSRLYNGNTLIVDPYGRRVFEVTHDKELVWEYYDSAIVTGATRFGSDELPFLNDRSTP